VYGIYGLAPAAKARLEAFLLNESITVEGKRMVIKQQIREYLGQNFLFSSNGFDLSDDASFLEEGIVDSTGVLELVMFVEETFNVAVDDEEIVPDNFDTVNSLVTYIAHKLS
jgi:acyl carrier protein